MAVWSLLKSDTPQRGWLRLDSSPANAGSRKANANLVGASARNAMKKMKSTRLCGHSNMRATRRCAHCEQNLPVLTDNFAGDHSPNSQSSLLQRAVGCQQ